MEDDTMLWQEFATLVRQIADAIEATPPLIVDDPFFLWPLTQIKELHPLSAKLGLPSSPILVNEEARTLYLSHLNGGVMSVPHLIYPDDEMEDVETVPMSEGTVRATVARLRQWERQAERRLLNPAPVHEPDLTSIPVECEASEAGANGNDRGGRSERDSTAAYEKALQVVYDTGRQMEASPSTYEGRGEEAIRDHLLSVLASHFQSVTGETFNKKGKTDILITHDKVPILLAECKFWGGEKLLLATVDQMLGYCTWRNRRTAVLLFVRNKEVEPVLRVIEALPKTHPCCVSSIEMKKHGWYAFDFHLPDDQALAIRVAVLCFHFPQPAKGKNSG